MTIENVSDTARWVAVYRAMETARPDAIFKDPFADRADLSQDSRKSSFRLLRRRSEGRWHSQLPFLEVELPAHIDLDLLA